MLDLVKNTGGYFVSDGCGKASCLGRFWMVGQLEYIHKLLLAQSASYEVAIALEDYVKGLQGHIEVQGTKVVLELGRNNLIILGDFFED